MEYKKGFRIKPDKVQEDGVILFTDGTNDNIYASEVACKAYGYNYSGGLCRAFKPNANLDKLVHLGANNVSDKNIPADAVLDGDNTRILINGEDHIIEQSIKNSTILSGRGGKARAHGESVLAAQNPVPLFGPYAQCSIVMLNASTTDNTSTTMTNQIHTSEATGIATDYIPLPKNSIVGIEMYITRLELGGSSGTAGNYSYRRQQSCVKIDNSAAGTFVNFNTKNIAKIGVNGTMAMTGATLVNFDGDEIYALSVNVADRNNVNNAWSAILYLHITETAIEL